jgi:phage terminase small subunit
MRMKVRKLTKKQKLFVVHLPQANWVGSEAVRRAGYRVKDDQSACEIAYQLLQFTPVKEAVERESERQLQKVGVKTEMVLSRMARIGFADIRKIFGPNNTLLDVKDWPDDIVPAVAGVETFEEYQGKGEDRVLIGHTKKVRLWDPNPSLTNMARNVGALGNGKHLGGDEDGDIVKVITPLELSAKMYFYLELVMRRSKEIEAKQAGELPKKIPASEEKD